MQRTTIIILAALTLLPACGSGDTDSDAPLVIYSGRSEELVEPLIEEFEAETGISVEVRYSGSTELAATLLAEGDGTDADVFFAQDPASIGAVKELLSTLPDSTLDRVDARFNDSDGKWVGTSGRVRVFVYNKGTTSDLPETIDDVVENPEWVGQLGVAPTNGSFLAFVSAMIVERGEVATLEWLEKLAAAQPTSFEGNSPIVTAVNAGEIEAGLVNHYYLLRLRAEGSGGDAENWFIPAGDVGTLVMPAGVGILAGTDRPQAAQQFVDFLLSDSSQQFFVDDTFEYSLTGIAANPQLPPLDEINSPDIDLSELADNLNTATRLVSEAGLV
ncbi:MAG TPA: extracellular solute-binding protein [Acidimicrobiia bacterium]